MADSRSYAWYLHHQWDDRLVQLTLAYLDGFINTEELAELQTLLEQDESKRNMFVALCIQTRQIAELEHPRPVVQNTWDKEKDGLYNPNDPLDPFSEEMLLCNPCDEMDCSGERDGDLSGDLDVERIRREAEQRLVTFLEQERERRRDLSPVPRYRDWSPIDFVRGVYQKTSRLAQVVSHSVHVLLLVLALAFILLVGTAYIHSNRVIATLDNEVAAQWSVPLTEQQLRPGWLELEQGFASISFKQGVQVLVQAPAEFRLISANRMFLEAGTITAKIVNPEADFTVDSPTSRITDLGTEFGVYVGSHHQAEVHVFDGQVRLQTAPPGKSLGSTKGVAIHQGQAARVETDGSMHTERVDNRPTLFMRQIPDIEHGAIPGKQFNLADVVGGGTGYGTGRKQGIVESYHRSSLGQQRSLLLTHAAGNGSFAPQPYLDLVFDLTDEPGITEITSTGLRFDQAPRMERMPRKKLTVKPIRQGAPLRVDLSQSGAVEPGWEEWQTGVKLNDVRTEKSFSPWFAPALEVVFDRVDTRNRARVHESVPLHRLLSGGFKNTEPVVMHLRNLPPGHYAMTTFHHDSLEDDSYSDGTIEIVLRDANGTRYVTHGMSQSWGPRPLHISSADYSLVSDGNEVTIVFVDNDDGLHNEAHINGFELNQTSRFEDPEASIRLVPCFAGWRDGVQERPVIWTPTNTGVSFDLDAIRETLGQLRINRFRSQCRLLSMPSPEENSAPPSFWVLVDGIVRFQYQMVETETSIPMELPLTDRDRFLTLLVTHNQEEQNKMECLFVAPCLNLSVPRDLSLP